MASATAVVFESLPIRASALKQILKTIDPRDVAEEERKAAETLLKKNAKKVNKKSKAPSNAAKKKPERKTVFLPTPPPSPPSSPEPEERPRLKGGRDVDNRNLFQMLEKVVKTRPPKMPRKKKVVEDEEFEEEEEQAPPRDTTWFEGIATPEDLDIRKLHPQGKYFLGKYKILDVIELDETRGATYMAYRNKYEVVLRVNFIQKDDMELMNTEAKFLEMMELNDAQHFFSTLFDMGLVNKHKADGKFYYATIYRGGPTLEQCHVLCKGVCTSETVDRIAAQLIKIFEQMFGQGYRMLAFALKDFKIDARSRVVFLANYSSIVKASGEDYDETEYEEYVDMTDTKKRRIAWEGEEDFAPIKWHQNGDDHVMSEMDSIESLVYLLIHMYMGTLPWRGLGDKGKWKRAHANDEDSRALILHLPPSLKCLWKMVSSTITPHVSFDLIHRMFTRYSDDNDDFCYDWEAQIPPSEAQERLICLKDIIEDTRRRMGAMECIFENEDLLLKK